MPDSQTTKTCALFDNSANRKLIAELDTRGAKIFLFPDVQIEEIPVNNQTEELLRNLSEFDWLIFTDVFAVEYFLAALERLQIDLFELDALRVCAFGETVADRLRFAQLHSDVIANTIDTTQVFRALTDYLIEETSFENLRFLVPMRENSLLETIVKLRESKADIIEVVIYSAQIIETELLPKYNALLKGGAIDEFVFNSPEEITKLSVLFAADEFPTFFNETIVSATGEATLQSLREFNLEPRRFKF